MGTTARTFMKTAYALYGAVLVMASAPANAAIDVSDSPLFLTVAVPPNITLTLDDSLSMAAAFVPEFCNGGNDCSDLDTRWAKSSKRNLIYYNPRILYPAPKNASGTALTTSFTSAWRNGFDQRTSGTAALGTRNLTNEYRPTAYVQLDNNASSEAYMDHFDTDVTCTNPATASQRRCAIGGVAGTLSCNVGGSATDRTNYCRTNNAARDFPAPAYYYEYYEDAGVTRPSGCPTAVASRIADDDCYLLRIVSNTAGLVDADGDGDKDIADQQLNFANWYSFARTRTFATQTAASLSFVDLPASVRVAWQSLNSCHGSSTNFVDSNCEGWRGNLGFTNAIKDFADVTGSPQKTNFYSWLFQQPTIPNTPLRGATQRVGEYYKRTGRGNPYDNNLLSNADDTQLACRRNYHVLMTDGLWRSDPLSSAPGNRDGSSTTLPDATAYTPQSPYGDTHSNTLADVAFQYWAGDLVGSLEDNLLPTYRDTTGTATVNYWNAKNDPATWQHMVNFTIGLGLTGYLAESGLTWDKDVGMYGGSYESLRTGATSWPAPGDNADANVADLWHAAINSRGRFFSADDPASLSVAFRAALTAITDDSGSSAALSANSTSLTGTTLVYQAKFNAEDWSGTLLALQVNTATGEVITDPPAWDASTRVPAHGQRKIFTHNGTAGVEFSSCTTLSAAQQAFLNTNSGGVVDNRCAERLEWLRGNPKDEVRTTTGLRIFRNRPETVMGDIVNSDPAYVKDVDYGYAGLPASIPGQSTYASYVSGNSTKMPMVYVGANDGMMHGFRGDGGPTGAADSGVEKLAYVPGGVFHNLSHLTNQTYSHRYYADGSITVRDAFIGGSWKTILVAGLNAGGRSIYALDVTDPVNFDQSKVLWEFDAGDDAEDLGLTYSRPQIGILESGQWVAVFGNGYNSPDGGAHLYVVDLATGALIRKLTAQDTVSVDDQNGLSTPILVDTDDNKLIDRAYAGDLQGNLWRFNLSGASSSWSVANGGAALFRGTVDSTSDADAVEEPQPITSQPKVTPHHLNGYLVVFGTGRYITDSDVHDSSRETVYGIWDDNVTTGTATRANLQSQNFDLHQYNEDFGRTVRSVTNNTVDWGGGKRGWFLDLLNGVGVNAPEIGERVVHTPLIAAGRAIFNTITPSTDPCSPGGTSWLLELKLTTGGAFTNSILDLNNDGLFNNEDAVEVEGENGDSEHVVINAVSNDMLGISNTPIWLEGAEPKAFKIGTGTTGNFANNKNCTYANEALCDTSPPTPPIPGVTRRSWIQIR